MIILLSFLSGIASMLILLASFSYVEVRRVQSILLISSVPLFPEGRFRGIAMGVMGGAIGFFVATMAAPTSLGVQAGFFAMGSVLPLMYRRDKKAKDLWRLLKLFPDFLESLSLGLSSGLPFHQAWRSSVEGLEKGKFKDDLGILVRAMDAGLGIDDAMDILVKRFGDPRLTSSLRLINQSVKRGMPVADMLVEQAETLRYEMFMAMEKRAQTASLRMLVPTLLFIFPPIFIVMLGPLVLRYIQLGGFF